TLTRQPARAQITTLHRQVINSATCPGLGPCNPGGLSANPVQATAGPSPFPGQDNYTQPPAGGFVGSRGDANVTSISFNAFGAGAQNAAEPRHTASAMGGATGTNRISTTVIIEIPSTSTQAINFTFTADLSLANSTIYAATGV